MDRIEEIHDGASARWFVMVRLVGALDRDGLCLWFAMLKFAPVRQDWDDSDNGA